MHEKFAAKFTEAGNLKLQDVSQISHVVTTRNGLDIDRFPQHFSAGCFSRGIWDFQIRPALPLPQKPRIL